MKDLKERIYLGIGLTLLIVVSLWVAFEGIENLIKILEAIKNAPL